MDKTERISELKAAMKEKHLEAEKLSVAGLDEEIVEEKIAENVISRGKKDLDFLDSPTRGPPLCPFGDSNAESLTCTHERASSKRLGTQLDNPLSSEELSFSLERTSTIENRNSDSSLASAKEVSSLSDNVEVAGTKETGKRLIANLEEHVRNRSDVDGDVAWPEDEKELKDDVQNVSGRRSFFRLFSQSALSIRRQTKLLQKSTLILLRQ